MGKKILISLFYCRMAFGATFFMPDSDTALLIELVTTTISQLNELENLVTNAEKLTGTIQKYNEVTIDHWYRAQRVAYLAESLSTLSTTKIKNLGQLNQAIRELKYNILELEDLMLEYGILKKESQNIAQASVEDDQEIQKEGKLAEIQIQRAHQVKTPGNLQKVNTQTNAYANKHLVDLKNKSNQQIRIFARRNEVIAIEKERKIQKEIEKRNFYGITRSTSNPSTGH